MSLHSWNRNVNRNVDYKFRLKSGSTSEKKSTWKPPYEKNAEKYMKLSRCHYILGIETLSEILTINLHSNLAIRWRKTRTSAIMSHQRLIRYWVIKSTWPGPLKAAWWSAFLPSLSWMWTLSVCVLSRSKQAIAPCAAAECHGVSHNLFRLLAVAPD